MANDVKGSRDGRQLLSSSYADWGLGVAIGLSFGIALGAALGNLGIGFTLGAAFTVVYALMMGDLRKRHEEDEELVGDRATRE